MVGRTHIKSSGVMKGENSSAELTKSPKISLNPALITRVIGPQRWRPTGIRTLWFYSRSYSFSKSVCPLKSLTCFNNHAYRDGGFNVSLEKKSRSDQKRSETNCPSREYRDSHKSDGGYLCLNLEAPGWGLAR